jgi:IMP dehydrogenase
MSGISPVISRSLREYTIRTAHTPRDLTYRDVDLSVELAPGIRLTYPLVAAAMACVSGYRMAEACANNGVMAVVPCSFSMEDQARIIADVKKHDVTEGDVELVERPEWIEDVRTVREAVGLYNDHGHSTIPIGDRHQRLQATFKYQQGIPGYVLDTPLSDVITQVRSGSTALAEVVEPVDVSKGYRTDWCRDTDGPDAIKQMLQASGKRFIPVVNEHGLLEALAFTFKHEGRYVGAALHTHEGWQTRAEALYEAGADVFFFDSSDGHCDYQGDAIQGFKSQFDRPIYGGNIIDAAGYEFLVDAGADGVKVGMATGGSCITGHNRGVGRGIATSLQEVWEAREKSARKVPIIADGGIGVRRVRNTAIKNIGGVPVRDVELDPASITKALKWSDAVMMGTGFNVFEEAEGETRDHQGKRYKKRWGEGSLEAQSLARYGLDEQVRRAAIEEGVSDFVTCLGHLKRGVEQIALNVAATFAGNVGARNIEEFQRMAALELMSELGMREMGVD